MIRYPECWNATKAVPYHDGMTLRPGQTVIPTIDISIPDQSDVNTGINVGFGNAKEGRHLGYWWSKSATNKTSIMAVIGSNPGFVAANDHSDHFDYGVSVNRYREGDGGSTGNDHVTVVLACGNASKTGAQSRR